MQGTQAYSPYWQAPARWNPGYPAAYGTPVARVAADNNVHHGVGNRIPYSSVNGSQDTFVSPVDRGLTTLRDRCKAQGYTREAALLDKLINRQPVNPRSYKDLATSLIRILSLYDPVTATHSVRVAELATLIGKQMGLSDKKLESLRYAALLHDIGKIGVDEKLINKKGRLTRAEKARMEKHVEYTYDILSRIGFSGHLKDVPLQAALHHQHYDGTGYAHRPWGKGTSIPMMSRILTVADVFDAITAHRQYRDRMPFSQMMREMILGSAREFDSDVVKAFLNVSLKDFGRMLTVDKFATDAVDMLRYTGFNGAKPRSQESSSLLDDVKFAVKKRFNVATIADEVRNDLSHIPDNITMLHFLNLLEKRQPHSAEKPIIEAFRDLYYTAPISTLD